MKKSESGNYTVYEGSDPNSLHDYSQTIAKENENRDRQFEVEQENQNTTIESLQKENEEIKEENSRLKEDLNAFPTVSGSGEYVTLDTADSRFKDFKIFGKSEQETKSGKNKLEEFLYGTGYNTAGILIEDSRVAVSNFINVQNIEKVIVSGLPATMYSNIIYFTETLEYLERTSVGHFDTIKAQIPQTAKYARLNISTAGDSTETIDKLANYKIQFEEGEIATEYEQGGAMPSILFPSKIRNVGDNINIFNKNAIFGTNGAKVEVLDTGIRVIDISGAKFDYVSTILGKEELLGETVTAYSDLLATAGTTPGILLYFGTDVAPTSGGIIQKINSNSPNAGTWKIPSEFPNGSDTIRIYLYVGGNNPAPVGGRVDYTNLKVEIGETPSPYSEHGYGNSRIIISNENLGNAEQLYNEMNISNPNNVRKEIVDGKNCIVFANSSFRTATGFKGLKGKYKKNTRYVIRAKARVYDKTLKDSYALYIQACNKNEKAIGTDSHVANAGNWVQFSFLTNVDSSLEYIDFSYGNSAYWCLDMDSLEIYEATKVKDVENNKETNIVFPFESSQRLMEGDYLADDGIHHKKRQIELDGITYGLRVESVTLSSTSSLYYCVVEIPRNIAINDINGMYCSHLIAYYGIKLGACYITNYGKYIVLVLNDQTLNTKEAVNAWLNKLYTDKVPITIEYKLAEEEVEEYTEAQKGAWKQIENLRSYEGQTNIFSNDEVSPVFEVTAKSNLSETLSSLDEKIGDIDTALDTINGEVV